MKMNFNKKTKRVRSKKNHKDTPKESVADFLARGGQVTQVEHPTIEEIKKEVHMPVGRKDKAYYS